MKRMILGASIIALAAFGNTTNAQSTQEKKTTYTHPMPKMGIKGGVNLSGLTNFEGNYRVTGQGGIFVQHKINENWVFQPEILYSAQGQKYTTTEGQKRTLALDYIQAPFMMQYYPAQKFYVEVGPQVGYLINSESKNLTTGDDKTSVDGGYRKVDFGVNAGLGLNFTDHVGLYARYTQGFVDVTKSADNYKTNNLVSVGAAIKF